MSRPEREDDMTTGLRAPALKIATAVAMASILLSFGTCGSEAGSRRGISIGLGVTGAIGVLGKLANPGAARSSGTSLRSSPGQTSKKSRSASKKNSGSDEEEGRSRKSSKSKTASRKKTRPSDADPNDRHEAPDTADDGKVASSRERGGDRLDAPQDDGASETAGATAAAGPAPSASDVSAAQTPEQDLISTASEITIAQEHLRYLGYGIKEINGVVDLDTKIAVMRYQEALGAPPTGALTVEQMQRLFQMAADRQAKAK